jgi:hypothetical protein
MIFGKKKQLEPAYDIAALRTELQSLCTRARNAGLRHYQISALLEEAAREINVRHEMATPGGGVSLDVKDVLRFLNGNTRA